jgi:aminoglycoside phosphotransferase (APT) family kinase protein
MSDTAPIRPGEELDLAALTGYLQPHLPADRYEIAQFPSGHSNLTYLLRAGDREYVLRRAPLGPVPPKAHDMAREYHVLQLLHPVFPPAPAPIHLCEDPAIIGAVFYLMERRHGIVYRDPAEVTTHARAHAEAIVDTLVRLHAVDIHAAGLDAIGKPAGFLERQVTGWIGRWQQAALPSSPDASSVINTLASRIPPPQEATVVHNDYKLDNVMFSPDGKLTAVLDWEMTTVGDPMADLGLALCYWELGGALTTGQPPPAGWLTTTEFIERYDSQTGRDMTQLAWHRTLGVFKLAVILQQIYVRYVRGQTTDERFAGFGERVERLIARARELAA